MGYSSSQDISKAQETLYAALLASVKTLEPEAVLDEFKQLFIYQVEVRNPRALQAVYDLVLTNNRQVFFYTLKRCCFILINNWGAARIYEPIHQLIATLSDSAIYQFTYSHNLRRLRSWLVDFANSPDYESLKLFTERYGEKGRWSQRYASYLLVPQYSDHRNPLEQREAARALSKQLRDRFRFDLAMYVARSQTTPPTVSRVGEAAVRAEVKNPTQLGDSVLRLIKMIVLRRGKHSYENLAQLFLQQTEQVSYAGYKSALLKYLVFSVDNRGFVQIFLQRLTEKLEDLYCDRDSDPLNEELAFRTCNRIIQFLTTENDESPTALFSLLISQGGPLTLVVVLLKLILIAPTTRNRLEYCIAKLIQHYEDLPADDCHWFINFLEVFSVTFAIYVEDVQYNLVKISAEDMSADSTARRHRQSAERQPLLDDYRIFSQRRSVLRLEPTPVKTPATLEDEVPADSHRPEPTPEPTPELTPDQTRSPSPDQSTARKDSKPDSNTGNSNTSHSNTKTRGTDSAETLNRWAEGPGLPGPRPAY